MTLTPAEIAAHADAIRTRLLELHERLKVDFPVYALFTKADLVAGFMEFFGGLGENGRKQVWGATFQTDDKTRKHGRRGAGRVRRADRAAERATCPTACRTSRPRARASRCSAFRRRWRR